MGNIRRFYLQNRPVFLTTVCHGRKPVLAKDEDKALLLEIMREVKAERPFRMLGYVVLADHFHWLIHPETGTDFSSIMQSVKLRFTHRYKALHGLSGNIVLWQRRFWDHLIRDQEDFNRHLDYIHYNPVKHGRVSDPALYRWSSFSAYLAKGRYGTGWGISETPKEIASMDLE